MVVNRRSLPWPSKGKNPFATLIFTPDSPTWINLEWMKFRIDDSSLAFAYKESADRIIQQLARQRRHRHHDALFLPIVYLYRHCFELQLKQIIRLGVIPQTEKIDGPLTSHNLCKLWKYVERVVDEVYPGSSSVKDFVNAGKIIKTLHDVDRSGETLRYSQNLKGQKHAYPKYVELKQVRNKCDELYNFLKAVEAALEHANSMAGEVNSF